MRHTLKHDKASSGLLFSPGTGSPDITNVVASSILAAGSTAMVRRIDALELPSCRTLLIDDGSGDRTTDGGGYEYDRADEMSVDAQNGLPLGVRFELESGGLVELFVDIALSWAQRSVSVSWGRGK